jgi:hypothetical protein
MILTAGGIITVWFSPLSAHASSMLQVAFTASSAGLAVLLSAIYELKVVRAQTTRHRWTVGLVVAAISICSQGILLSMFLPDALLHVVQIVAIAFAVAWVAASTLDGSERWLLNRPSDE